MNQHVLKRWQTTILAEKLWATQQGLIVFEHLEPTTKTNPARMKTTNSSAARPRCLSVRVRALPELGIPEHMVYMMSTDYERALRSLTKQQRAAWDAYTQKPRSSAIYGVRVRPRYYRRQRGETHKTHYVYIERMHGINAELEFVAGVMWRFARCPNVEELLAAV